MASVVLSPSTMAQSMADRGWYIGGSIGQSEADDDCPSGFSCDLKDTAYKLFGGYRFNRNFAAEAFWGEWGEISVSAGGATATVEARTIGIAGLGILPVSPQFDLFGKIGIGNTELKATGSGLAAGLTAEDDGSDLMLGLGAVYNFTRNLGVRAEWERFTDSELDILSIGLQYRF